MLSEDRIVVALLKIGKTQRKSENENRVKCSIAALSVKQFEKKIINTNLINIQLNTHKQYI